MSRLRNWTLGLQFTHYLLAVLGVVVIGLLTLGWRAAKADDRYVPKADYQDFRDDVIRRLGAIDGKLDVLTDIERRIHLNER